MSKSLQYIFHNWCSVGFIFFHLSFLFFSFLILHAFILFILKLNLIYSQENIKVNNFIDFVPSSYLNILIEFSIQDQNKKINMFSLE